MRHNKQMVTSKGYKIETVTCEYSHFNDLNDIENQSNCLKPF